MKDVIIGVLGLIILVAIGTYLYSRVKKDKTSEREKPSGPYRPGYGGEKPQDNKK
jgi:uncharacterized protein YxeA